MFSHERRFFSLAKTLRFFLTLSVCLLLPISVHADLIIEDPSPGLFAGAFVIPLDETLPAAFGDESFTMTVGGGPTFLPITVVGKLWRRISLPRDHQ